MIASRDERRRTRASTAPLIGALAWLCVLAVGCSDDADRPPVNLTDAGDTTAPDVPTPDPPPETFETVTCEGAADMPQPAEGQRCAVQSGNDRTLLLRGDIATGDTLYERGSVVVDRQSGAITCAGCGCGTTAEAAGATVVGCPDAVVSPGLINPHEHLGWSTAGPAELAPSLRYDHRHEWRVGANDKPRLERPDGQYSREALLYGELRHLVGGATAVAGSARGSSVEGLLRNLDAGPAGVDADVNYSTFPLGDTDGTLREDSCEYGNLDAVDVLAADTYLPHVSEGLGGAARNEFSCLSSNEGAGRDLVAANTTIVHGIGMTAGDIRELGAEGGALVWSPRSNIALYGQTADIPTYMRLDVPVALGTDWAPSGSRNMLRELNCAARYNRQHLDGQLSDWELWRMATVDAADVLGVGRQVGDIRDGQRADIAIFEDADDADYGAVVGAGDEDVVLVLRDGEVLYGDADLTAQLQVGSGCSQFEGCQRRRSVCLPDDDGSPIPLEALRSAAGDDSYPLVACADTDLGEPTCTPSRPGEYDGTTSKTDPDGDGYATSEDNCPAVFNPARPLEGAQPDADADGSGDTCDPCPTRAGDCEASDRDQDGHANRQDNCPYTANAAQSDADGDALGDACDDCAAPNPGRGPCPTSVYTIRQAPMDPGTRVRLEDVVVTAAPDLPEQGPVEPPAVFVQMSPEDNRWTGPQNSGIYVYVGEDVELPRRGDVVSVDGVVKNFYGLLEIGAVSELDVQSADLGLPVPVSITPDQVAGMQPDHPLMGTLVATTDATVSNDDPDGSNTQFRIQGGLQIGDLLHVIEPPPKNGGVFDRLAGPLHYSWNSTKLLPRDADDVGGYTGERKPGRPSSEGAMVITELMPNPQKESDADGEWFELHHPGGSKTYNLGGCELVEGDDDVHSIDRDLLVEPAGWVALARSDSPGFSPDYVYSGVGLTNSGGSVALRCRGQVIDTVSYDEAAVDAGAAWSLGADNLEAQANDSAGNWCFATDAYNGDLGTPGAPNPRCGP